MTGGHSISGVILFRDTGHMDTMYLLHAGHTKKFNDDNTGVVKYFTTPWTIPAILVQDSHDVSHASRCW